MNKSTMWSAAAALLLAMGALGACTASKAEVDEDFSDLASVDQKADYFSAKLKLLGTLTDGGSDRVRYTSNPRFRGYAFTAAEGDQVDVWVKGPGGDALAWVVDGKFKVIAKNDDASDQTYDSHIVTKLPASGVAGGKYYVIFRDYDMTSHYFTTSLKLQHGAGGDGAWLGAAEAEVTRLVDQFTGLDPLVVAMSTLPAAAKARAQADAEVLEAPSAYKVTVSGRPFYLVLTTDGSGEGNVVVVDLIDRAGVWFDHGIGHAVWDGGGGFNWTLDPSDPTMCKCISGAGAAATCTWMDGTVSRSTEITCE